MVKNRYNIRENLLNLVKMFPEVKDNYNMLLYYYWRIFDHATTPDKIAKATPAESITRIFRKLVESCDVTLSEETLNKRKKAEVEFKSDFAHMF